MNTIDIDHIYPRVLNFHTWRNSKKIRQRINKFAQTYRFIYVKQGICNICIDGDSYDCGPGSIFFLPPGTCYSSLPLSDEIFIFNTFFDLVHSDKEIDSSAFDSTHLFTKHNIIDKYFFTDFPVFNEPRLFESEAAAHICNKILRETEKMCLLYSEYLDVYIHQMFLCLARETASEDTDKSTEITQKIIDYIAKNVKSPIDVSCISRHFSYHPNYISRIMKKATGTSLHKYILDEKLKVAENLICHTDISITDIAFELSFNNSSHFTQKFKKKYGITPTEYRRKYS